MLLVKNLLWNKLVDKGNCLSLQKLNIVIVKGQMFFLNGKTIVNKNKTNTVYLDNLCQDKSHESNELVVLPMGILKKNWIPNKT